MRPSRAKTLIFPLFMWGIPARSLSSVRALRLPPCGMEGGGELRGEEGKCWRSKNRQPGSERLQKKADEIARSGAAFSAPVEEADVSKGIVSEILRGRAHRSSKGGRPPVKRTSVCLPERLYKLLKIYAAMENKKLNDLMVELLTEGLRRKLEEKKFDLDGDLL